MKINSEIRKIYDSEGLNNNIVYDGIIDENSFGYCQKIRTTFLLKDANDAERIDGDSSNADLCNNLLKATRKGVLLTKMYRVVSMWTKLLEEKSEECWLQDCYTENFVFDVEKMRKYLKYISVINIRKENGKGQSNPLELEESVKNYYEKIVNEEIKLVNPELIVCCGTFDYITLKNSFLGRKIESKEIKIMRLHSGERYFKYENRVYLEMEHPAARLGYSSLFSRFKEAVNALQFDKVIEQK